MERNHLAIFLVPLVEGLEIAVGILVSPFAWVARAMAVYLLAECLNILFADLMMGPDPILVIGPEILPGLILTLYLLFHPFDRAPIMGVSWAIGSMPLAFEA